ncbi:hypothetical protein ACFVVL_14400 [Kitasatospora sp. NPDC058115]
MTNDASVLLRAYRGLAGRDGPGGEPARRVAVERPDEPLHRPAAALEG